MQLEFPQAKNWPVPARPPAPASSSEPTAGGREPDAPGMTLDVEHDRQLDGFFVGAEGQTFPSVMPWDMVPPMLPNNGKPVSSTVLMVNGIMTDVALQASDMQCLANTGCSVVGIHNATRGMLLDLAQCLGDKLNVAMANNKATQTVAQAVADCLQKDANKPTLILGHSQGALVLSNALADAQSGTTPEAADRLRTLEVATLGGASWTFPEGPRYTHIVNTFDAVPMAAGVGAIAGLTTGAEDKIVRFNEFHRPTNLPDPSKGMNNYLARAVDRAVHGPQDVYIAKL